MKTPPSDSHPPPLKRWATPTPTAQAMGRPTVDAGGVHGDALECIQSLRAALTDPGGVGDWAGEQHTLVSNLLSGIDQVLAEHRGMTEELLCVYEQLGVIFEVTRRLPEMQNETEVLDLFLASLRRSFAGRQVFLARRRRAGGWAYDDTELTRVPWLNRLLDLAQERRSVQVESSPGGAWPTLVAEVMVGPVFSGDTLVRVLVLARTSEAVPFRAAEMLLVESLTTFCGDLIRSHRLVHELREMSISMVRSLVSAVDQKDQYTCGHSLRVAYYATALGKQLKLRAVDLQMLQWSALLHDVGKIGIRDEVLNKQGKLTPEEFRHIQEHPTRSHKVVQQVPQLADALDGVLYHHEHYDGGGYPAGLKGEDIPLQARIIQIADVFDALTSSRSYRQAYDWRRALAILEEEAGKTVDPNLQKVFDAYMRQRLENNAGAWDDMVRRANESTHALDGGHDRGGSVHTSAQEGE